MQTDQPQILIVDDEPSNLFLLEELLQLEGYLTLSATSGWEALEITRTSQPDLILLDIMMPSMDGYEVCQILRQDRNFQSVPILFLTALDDDQSRLKGLTVMGDDYLTKPINSDLLLTKISSILRLQNLRKQSQEQQLNQLLKQQLKKQLSVAWEINEYLSEKFRLFVPEQFLQRIAPQGVESIQLGNATEEEVTILFCDIRGFTSIAESQTGQETFTWLNAFFTQMNQAINSHFGFIDKYLGDAIMAVFDRQSSHADDALQSAVAMRKNLKAFNERCQDYQLKTPVEIGIGIHTGIGIIGTLGSDLRMDSTVIGDVVNTAARLESLTKIYGCQILASQATIDQIRAENFSPEMLGYRWVDQVAPRGKQTEIELYEILIAEVSLTDQMKLRSHSLFHQALQFWRDGNYNIALQKFQEIVAQNPQDLLAQLYCDRCLEKLSIRANLPQPQSNI